MNPSQNTANPNQPPRWDVIIVTLALALFALGGLGGIIFLIDSKAESGSVAIVSSLVGTAVGSLASMLVSTSNKGQATPAGTPDAPIATTNVNPPNDPVLTTAAPTTTTAPAADTAPPAQDNAPDGGGYVQLAQT